ncbi:MAG TPA: hypothetical protein VN303_14575, partial [Pseudomonas sp.]|nr:hypothetical protein [Pseudomonas sp.]
RADQKWSAFFLLEICHATVSSSTLAELFHVRTLQVPADDQFDHQLHIILNTWKNCLFDIN